MEDNTEFRPTPEQPRTFTGIEVPKNRRMLALGVDTPGGTGQ
ncbi:MAG: hypothetical protein PVJ13_11280 [Desulfobacterales bacterium]|jgi:hypothetical protein